MKLRGDNKGLVANCQTHLVSTLSDNAAFTANNDVAIGQIACGLY